ncbi:MAG TPA: L,D-transpeptidase [Acidimicrobiales bacterium]|nr:L,D-transpeptidase [Acidimicrobiales bacterium]
MRRTPTLLALVVVALTAPAALAPAAPAQVLPPITLPPLGGSPPVTEAPAVADAPAPVAEAPPAGPPVPEGSGSGRRVVYSNGAQRIWLVEADGSVTRTYLVSGRRNFPRPGTYSVFSRSPVSRSGSLRLEYMVRWYQSRRLAVGFHAIPTTRSGRPIQTEAELGRFASRGCVRQSVADAAFLWDWAQIGTPVIAVP